MSPTPSGCPPFVDEESPGPSRLPSYRTPVFAPGTPRLPVARGGAGFGCIVADPPWPFNDRGSRATPGYNFMSEREIVELPVGEVAAENAHLYLWYTDTHLDLARECVRAWGFEYRHQLVWVKMHPPRAIADEMYELLRDGRARAAKRVRENIGQVQMGMGHYFRKSHELIMFATRGRAPIANRALTSVVVQARGRHSAKPEELQARAELASPGPRLELFARRQRPGWTCWGNQI